MMDWTSFFIEEFATPGQLVGHVAYVVLIGSMLMRTMRKLRMLAILSGLISIVYGYFMLEDVVTVFWETIFVTVNAFELAVLELRNRRARFSEEEKQFIEKAVPGLERGEARRLLRLAKHEEREEGAVLTTQAQVVDELYFILSGAARVDSNGSMVGVCGANDFLGEIGFMGDGKASATATVTHPMRVLRFEARELTALLARHPSIRQAIEGTFNRNLVHKLMSVNRGISPEADTL